MSDRLVIDISRDRWENITRITAYVASTPVPDHIKSVTITKSKGKHPMAAAVGTVNLAPTKPEDHVTSRQVTVTLNGAALPPVEAISVTPTFPCNEGDTYSAVSVASNSVGPAGPSNVVSGTVTLPQLVPSPDVILGVAFAPAPA